MSFQTYLDSIKAKTGKTPGEFRALASAKGLLEPGVRTGQIVSWLKEDFGLGHGHAMAVVATLKAATQPRVTPDERVARLFQGSNSKWRATFDRLISRIREFGPDVSLSPTDSYIGILRKGKKFAIVQVTADRLDVGIKLKGADATNRFELAGAWNSMVTHRVRITASKEIDRQLLTWLRHAYDNS